ncbi:MAG: beta-ketoacyl-ACP synthase II [Pseudomonadota bacterium]
MNGRRVAVTGLGLVTSVGLDVETTWAAIREGRSGAASISTFDVSSYSTRFSASVREFDGDTYFSTKEKRKMDVFVQYGMAAGIQAFEDSGYQVATEEASRIGCAIGSGIGGIGQIEKNSEIVNASGPRKISPFFVPGSIINMIGGNLSVRYGLRGPNIAVVTACTTGTHNIGLAARMIAQGDADAMLAGGAEMATTKVGLGGFAAARALSTRNDDPEAASRPWDKDRDGFVLGDGAGVVMLEEFDAAVARGANIYAELVGFGMSGDAYHMTLPPEDGAGAAAAMGNALRDAKLSPENVQYINAHGTSTLAGDLAESRAIESVFGNAAQSLAVSSTKSMIGHLLGAAGSVEAIFSILAIRDQLIPPTINLENVDEGCVLDYVPKVARDSQITHALSNSFGFGGTNGSLIFAKV